MSKKSNSTKNHIAEREMRIMTNAELQVKFDAAVDDFDPSDEISVENANYEMHENWRKELERHQSPPSSNTDWHTPCRG